MEKLSRKKLNIMPGTGLCLCSNCKREFTIKSIEETPGCVQKCVVLDIKNSDGVITVTIFEDVIIRNFDETDKTRLKKKNS